MKSQGFFIALFCLTIFSACSSKKVLIMSNGKVTVNENTITLQQGGTHTETSVVPDGDSLIVVSPSGTSGYAVKENGLYILNLKKDTLVGSYQRTGTDNSQQVISQENLVVRIDSLQQLMVGKNATEASRNYTIFPLSVARITTNVDAQVVGPFLKMPGSFDASREHEVYKFYTNKEMAEIVDKLKKMVSDR